MMLNTFGVIFLCVLIYVGKTQMNGNNICELGDNCMGVDPDCPMDCANNVVNVGDPSTLVCAVAQFERSQDIFGCCIPTIRGRPEGGLTPPNCINQTSPNVQSSRKWFIYIIYHCVYVWYMYDIYVIHCDIYRMLWCKYWMWLG